MHRRTLLTAALAAPVAGLATTSEAAAASQFPAVIALPNGWRPEGIAAGVGTSFFVGSLANGAIYRGNFRTGDGEVFIAGTAGTAAVGLEIDDRLRIWACGGAGGGARVYSQFTGELLASYAFGGAFVNDAVATRSGVYFTDSQRPVLYHVPFGPLGGLPDPAQARTITLPPGLGDVGASNNGIESTPDGRLIVVQSAANRIYTFAPETGAAVRVDLGGASVERGDGLLRHGHVLYVVRNRFNTIAKFTFDSGYAEAALTAEITDPALDIPATIARFGPYLYAANARFTTPPTPETAYSIVRVRG